MKALMGYDYATGKWSVYSVYGSLDFVKSPDQMRKMLNERGHYLYPEWFEAELKYYKYENGKYSADLADDVEFPEVITLEQSIKNNQAILRKYVN